MRGTLMHDAACVAPLPAGDIFAIKCMTKAELVRKNMVESAFNERTILATTNNPFIVRCYYW